MATFLALALALLAPQGDEREIVTRIETGEFNAKLSAVGRPMQIALRSDKDGTATASAKIAGVEVALSLAPAKADGSRTLTVDKTAHDTRFDDSARGKYWKVPGTLAIAGRPFLVSVVADERGITAFVQSGFLRGEAMLGGVTWTFLCIDQDADGTLGSPGDFWTLVDASRIEAEHKIFSAHSMVERQEPVFLPDGKAARLARVDPTMTSVRLAVAPARESVRDYLARRDVRVRAAWDARFAGDLKELLASKDDKGRKKTEQPVTWIFDIDLEHARGRAAAAGKPLLVDFETDWCLSCKVLDRVAYADAEVADFVRESFVALKVSVDFATRNVTKEFGVDGYPAIVILDPQGRQVDVIRGEHGAGEFLAKLRSALTKAKAAAK